VIQNGGLLLYPTDTIWGIGCDPFNESSVAKIFNLKNRSKEKNFILLVADMNMLKKYVSNISKEIEEVLNNSSYPTTVIYNSTINLPQYLLAEDNSVAIRIIKHEYITPFIQQLGFPLVSTSANISGFEPPKSFNDIAPEILNNVDAVMPKKIDVCKHQKPSNIVKVNPDGTLFWIRK